MFCTILNAYPPNRSLVHKTILYVRIHAFKIVTLLHLSSIAYMSGGGDTALKYTSSPPGHCRDDLSCGVWRLEQSMKEKQTCNIES